MFLCSTTAPAPSVKLKRSHQGCVFPRCPCALPACPLVSCPMGGCLCLLGGICPQQPPPGMKMPQPACSRAGCEPQLYIPAHLHIPSSTPSSCSRRAHINSGLFSHMGTLRYLPAHDLNAETSLRTATVFWGHIFYPPFGLSLFFLSSESSPRRVGASSACAQSRRLRAGTLPGLRPRPCLGAEPGSPARCLATPPQMAGSGPSTDNHV